MGAAEFERLKNDLQTKYLSWQRWNACFTQTWKKWGPYVAERAWGTVREDYSATGDAWNYLPHDLARSKAYRWGEDGIAGICDIAQTVVFSWAFWNGKDAILKERMFGLNPFEGNHGEDLKEYYFYLDATPTHSYMKYLYKYPHNAFPYDQLVTENKRRSTHDPEYELIDTGIFKENRYFDIFIEYAKADAEDICIRIEAFNRGAEVAELHFLPQICFRNTWIWGEKCGPIPQISEITDNAEALCFYVDPTGLPTPKQFPVEFHLAPLYLYADKGAATLFTNNETHQERVYGKEIKSRTPFVKDAFHRALIQKENCVNPDKKGTKACFHYGAMQIQPGKSQIIHLRLTPKKLDHPLKDVEKIFAERKREADDFYAGLSSSSLSDEEKKIQRRALAGMLWGKQFYHYNVEKWLEGDNPQAPPPASRYNIRNDHWEHLKSTHVISMPDKWEYPWFASWDLAFQSVALSLVDCEFAKEQCQLLLGHDFQHPSGQIPAYEWTFSDVNPPVHPWAIWRIYEREKKLTGKGDRDFLEFGFLKLLYNFGWWVNKIDRYGNNFFEGGFLGLDNISMIDRSKPLKDGGYFEESDGTGWMGFFSLMMLRIALELAKEETVYEAAATTFFEHFIDIAQAIEPSKGRSIDLWDEEDGFFYDAISYPDGKHELLRIRSFVGIIPFYSLSFFEEEELTQAPAFYAHFLKYIQNNADKLGRCLTTLDVGGKKRYLFSLMNLSQMQRFLNRIWDPAEFRSPYGLRSLSKYHDTHPLIFQNARVGYEPAESLERIKGGNSNWRGPIWIPVNFLFLDALRTLERAIGESFKITVPNELPITLKTMADRLTDNLMALFKQDAHGHIPVNGDISLFQEDPLWKDHLLFYEYYHGDIGRGIGAMHQTGWSGLIANIIDEKN